MIVQIGELKDRFGVMLASGDLEGLIMGVRNTAIAIVSHPGFTGNALLQPDLDRLLYGASFLLRKTPVRQTDHKLLLHVATEVEAIGGHTRVIEDIVRAIPEKRHVVLLTDVMGFHRSGHVPLEPLRKRFDAIGLECILLRHRLPLTGMAEELAQKIAELAPQAILLHTHPYDALAHAVINVKSAPRVLFFHHMDYKPALGATRGDFIHLDLTPVCYGACQQYGFVKPSYLGLSVKDMGKIPAVKVEPLTAVTCASFDKYKGGVAFTYGEMAAAFFAAGLTKLYHIGSMADAQREGITAEIEKAGEDPSKMVFISNTPSLAQSLLEIAPTFYLGSYPIGGGKAVVEAMSVGLPIITPHTPEMSPSVCQDMTLGAGLVLAALEEIPQMLAKVRAECGEMGEKSRAVYDNHHAMPVFRRDLLAAMDLKDNLEKAG